MKRLIIKKLDEQTISIEDRRKGGPIQIQRAFYLADANSATGNVCIKNLDTKSIISVHYSEIEVDDLGVLDSAQETVSALNTFIGNFNSGGSSSSTTVSLTKIGINGAVVPSVFSWITKLQVSEVLLMSNAAGLSLKIGDETYDEASILGVELPAG
ncbi:MAG: hypothetical protein LBG15_07980, partial [Dysgonamonadaceae bacterium]|nr:hypothetical protein [Dysgonamonadaceae bacterium]